MNNSRINTIPSWDQGESDPLVQVVLEISGILQEIRKKDLDYRIIYGDILVVEIMRHPGIGPEYWNVIAHVELPNWRAHSGEMYSEITLKNVLDTLRKVWNQAKEKL